MWLSSASTPAAPTPALDGLGCPAARSVSKPETPEVPNAMWCTPSRRQLCLSDRTPEAFILALEKRMRPGAWSELGFLGPRAVADQTRVVRHELRGARLATLSRAHSVESMPLVVSTVALLLLRSLGLAHSPLEVRLQRPAPRGGSGGSHARRAGCGSWASSRGGP